MISVTRVLNECDSCGDDEEVYCVTAYKEDINEGTGMFLCVDCFDTLTIKFEDKIHKK